LGCENGDEHAGEQVSPPAKSPVESIELHFSLPNLVAEFPAETRIVKPILENYPN
jgi:hypothetical protein